MNWLQFGVFNLFRSIVIFPLLYLSCISNAPHRVDGQGWVQSQRLPYWWQTKVGIGQIMDIIEKVTDYPYLTARAKAHVPVKNQGDH